MSKVPASARTPSDNDAVLAADRPHRLATAATTTTTSTSTYPYPSLRLLLLPDPCTSRNDARQGRVSRGRCHTWFPRPSRGGRRLWRCPQRTREGGDEARMCAGPISNRRTDRGSAGAGTSTSAVLRCNSPQRPRERLYVEEVDAVVGDCDGEVVRDGSGSLRVHSIFISPGIHARPSMQNRRRVLCAPSARARAARRAQGRRGAGYIDVGVSGEIRRELPTAMTTALLQRSQATLSAHAPYKNSFSWQTV
ncbi:hypothetical protein DFH06DRAFT_461869 [Mycena polygramma]|nr:hypothetical protein DFH06DRAFT_461869 [Mycena polygramma]